MSDHRAKAEKARSLIDQYLKMSKRDVALGLHKAVIRKYTSQLYGAYMAHQTALVSFIAECGIPEGFNEVYEISRRRLVKSCLVYPYREKRDLIISVARAGGLQGRGGRFIKAEEEFVDIITDESVAWAEQESGSLIVGISAKTQAKVQSLIARAVEEGWSMPHVKKALMSLIGLDEARLAQLGNYELEQIASGVSGDALASRLERYETRLIRERAETIARTETAAASSEGTLNAFGQMGIEEVEGVSDPEACDDCAAEIDGQIFTLEEAKGKIPRHPRCECTWVAV